MGSRVFLILLFMLLLLAGRAQAQGTDSLGVLQRFEPTDSLRMVEIVPFVDSLERMERPLPVESLRTLQKTKLLDNLTPPPPLPPPTLESIVDTVIVRKIKRENAPRVFVDCGRCDIAFIRQKITFVNYVRDPKQAQVHVLIIDQGTASGGRTYTLAFIGQENFVGMNHTLTYTSLQNNTSDEERAGLNKILRLGLVFYVAHTPLADQLTVSFEEKEQAEQVPIEDKWNNWIFEVYAGGNFNKEALKNSLNLRYGGEANRVTERWKVRSDAYFNYNELHFDNDGEIISRKQNRNGFNASVIRSITNHWSVGAFSTVYTTTYDNIKLGIRFNPAIEYSLFPYEDALRKEVTLVYRAGFNRLNYLQPTIYEQMEETLYNQALQASVRIRQPWGSIYTQLVGSHYLHDFSKRRVEFYSSANLRLVEGLSLNFSGNFNIINDQLFLPKGEASLEDILLQQRRLATNYQVWGSIGLSYTFGSIYNNVVNTRL